MELDGVCSVLDKAYTHREVVADVNNRTMRRVLICCKFCNHVATVALRTWRQCYLKVMCGTLGAVHYASLF